MGASIRFFAVVGPYRDDESDDNWWPNVSHAYLRGFLNAGVAVRAITISGGGSYLDLAGDPEWGPWLDLAPMFSAGMSAVRVNIVCAPANMQVGRRMLPAHAGGGFVHATALSELWTANLYNVAITCGLRREHASELEALGRYDLVVPPNETVGAELRSLGLRAARRTPQELAMELADQPVRSYG